MQRHVFCLILYISLTIWRNCQLNAECRREVAKVDTWDSSQNSLSDNIKTTWAESAANLVLMPYHLVCRLLRNQNNFHAILQTEQFHVALLWCRPVNHTPVKTSQCAIWFSVRQCLLSGWCKVDVSFNRLLMMSFGRARTKWMATLFCRQRLVRCDRIETQDSWLSTTACLVDCIAVSETDLWFYKTLTSD